jgi:hypothetical protein
MTDPLDRYFNDFGQRLDDAARNPARRVRQPITWFAASALTCAAIAIVVLLVGGGSSTRPVDAFAAARKAITPSGSDIVYLRVTSRLVPIRGVTMSEEVRGPHTTEQWTASDPSRWRLVATIPASRRSGVVVSNGRRIVGREEFTYADHKQSTYDVRLGRVIINEGYAKSSPASQPLGPFPGDPQRTLPQLLRTGQLRDVGIVRAHGRTVHRLRRVTGRGPTLRVFTYDVDPKTFAPIAGALRIGSPVRQGSRGTSIPDLTETFLVDEYRRIPLNDRTARELTIHPPAGTTVIRYAANERARHRTRIATCRVRQDETLACPTKPPR